MLGLKLRLSCVHGEDFPDCSISLDVDGTKFLCSQIAVEKAELLNAQRGLYLFVLRKLGMDIFNNLVILAPCRARLPLNPPANMLIPDWSHRDLFLSLVSKCVQSTPRSVSFLEAQAGRGAESCDSMWLPCSPALGQILE